MHDPSASAGDAAVRALRDELTAESAAEPDIRLTLELVDALSDRYADRLAAGQPDLARDDLDESVQLLDGALARIGSAHPLYLWAARMAAAAHEERWTADGDPADRDETIRQLSAVLAAEAVVSGGAAAAAADLHASLARLLGSRYEDCAQAGPGGTDLEAAIGHARRGLSCCAGPAEAQGGSDQPGIVTDLRALLGLLLAYRFGERSGLDAADRSAVAAARADRDEAIAALEWVRHSSADDADADDADETAGFEIASTLGQLYADRHDDKWPDASPDPGDLDAAVLLLSAAARAGEPSRATVESLVLALWEKYEGSDSAAERDAFIYWGHVLLQLTGTADDGLGLRYLLAMALLDRAENSPETRPADLDAAIGHLEAELAATPPGDPDRPELVGTLARACAERLDGDASDYLAVDQMIGYADEAWHTLPAADEEDDSRTVVGLYLALGLHDRFRRPGQTVDLGQVELAIDVLRQIEPLEQGHPELHAVVVTVLAQLLIGRAQALGSAPALQEAKVWVMRAFEEVPVADPQFAEIVQTLAAASSTLAMLGLSADDLDKAVEVLTLVPGRASNEPGRDATNLSVLGSLLVQRAAFTLGRRDLNLGIEHLRASWDMVPDGSIERIRLAANLSSALITRFGLAGDAQDLDAAEYYLDAARDLAQSHHRDFVADAPDADRVLGAMRGHLLALRGMSDRSPATFDKAIASLQDVLAAMPPDHPHQARVRSDLGVVMLMRSGYGQARPADMAQAVTELNAAARAIPGGDITRPMALLRAAVAVVATAHSAGDARLLAEAIGSLAAARDELDPRFGERVRFTSVLGLARRVMHQLTGDAADIDEAIGWLEETRRELAGRPGHPMRGTCLMELARCYHARGDAAPSREAGLAALRERGRDVLLQTGTARGLGFARLAAEESTEVTGWCLEDDAAEAAVAALELGRSLILHAATAVTSVPEMLARANHHDLAEEWRKAIAAPQDRPWDAPGQVSGYGTGLLDGSAPLQLPADLRTRALAALAATDADRLLAPPSCADIAAALAETGADALVYLLDPAITTAGRAILVRSGSGPAPKVEILPIPLLHHSTAGPLTDYAAAYSALTSSGEPAEDGAEPADPAAAEQRWRQALEQLCDWAWPTVMSPLLQRAGQWGLGRPPRLTLVPAGRLSLVPWHAARSGPDLPVPDRYACSAAVISYAASGRQLLEVSARPALDLQADPVMVGNPALSLPYAELEAHAIRDQCYPAGRYLGHPAAVLGTHADGPGRPDEVLGQLPSAERPGASVLHLGCHARLVAAAPGQSFLELAGRKPLTVETILRQASGRPPVAPGGLVCLAACSSDHGGAAHDEALTLATAFLAAGAVTVAGARWNVRDGVTSLLMFMFHHYLTADGHPPRDALRLAQLWMLDPGRKAPPQMPGELTRLLANLGSPDVAAWAAFTHQGR